MINRKSSRIHKLRFGKPGLSVKDFFAMTVSMLAAFETKGLIWTDYLLDSKSKIGLVQKPFRPTRHAGIIRRDGTRSRALE